MLGDSEDLAAVQVSVSLYLPLLSHFVATDITGVTVELGQLLTRALHNLQSSSSSPVRRAIGAATALTLVTSTPLFLADQQRLEILAAIPVQLPEQNSRQNREEARQLAQLAEGLRQHQLQLAQTCLKSSTAADKSAADKSMAERFLGFATESLGKGTSFVELCFLFSPQRSIRQLNTGIKGSSLECWYLYF